MRMNRIVGIAATVAVIIGVACSALVTKAAAKTSPAETAIQAAARQNRYALVTFYKKNDSASTRMLAEAKKLHGKYASRANFVSADVGNAVHK